MTTHHRLASSKPQPDSGHSCLSSIAAGRLTQRRQDRCQSVERDAGQRARHGAGLWPPRTMASGHLAGAGPTGRTGQAVKQEGKSLLCGLTIRNCSPLGFRRWSHLSGLRGAAPWNQACWNWYRSRHRRSTVAPTAWRCTTGPPRPGVNTRPGWIPSRHSGKRRSYRPRASDSGVVRDADRAAARHPAPRARARQLPRGTMFTAGHSDGIIVAGEIRAGRGLIDVSRKCR
jgi:hypothetical protein